VHQGLREKINTTPGYDPVGYGLNPASLLMTYGHINGGVTLNLLELSMAWVFM